MLDLTGEEQTITITSDTVITRQTMQDPGSNGQGQAPDGNGAPDGQAPDSNGAPDGQAPNGSADSSETLSLSDLKEGDIVSVVLNDDGTAASITVQSMGGDNMGAAWVLPATSPRA